MVAHSHNMMANCFTGELLHGALDTNCGANTFVAG